ncbi:MAG TPA: trigger factor, partial [Lactococcus sp.]|nr:trigger factor [Lactococcus sp.]
QYQADAVKRVRTNLVIEAIAKAENFETTDEEVKAEIAELAEQYNMPVEQVEKLLPVDMLQHDIAMKKAVEAITSSAKVK